MQVLMFSNCALAHKEDINRELGENKFFILILTLFEEALWI